MPRPSLPVLDMSAFRAAPQSARGRDFVLRLRDVCHGVGFCYLVGHGVPAERDATIMAEKPQVAAFIGFYLNTVNAEVIDVGYFPAPAPALASATASWLEAVGLLPDLGY